MFWTKKVIFPDLGVFIRGQFHMVENIKGKATGGGVGGHSMLSIQYDA